MGKCRDHGLDLPERVKSHGTDQFGASENMANPREKPGRG
jgi:hypothetical protein